MSKIIERFAIVIMIISFFGLLFGGCTQDKGHGTFNVEAEVTAIGNTMISIKYYIGRTVVFDDIPMKNNIGILNMIREQNPDTIPLLVQIEFYTNSEPKEEGFLKYYYGANLLGESKSFDVASLIVIAKQNIDIFEWEVRDGKGVSSSDKKEKTIEPESPAAGTVSTPKKEMTEKL